MKLSRQSTRAARQINQNGPVSTLYVNIHELRTSDLFRIILNWLELVKIFDSFEVPQYSGPELRRFGNMNQIVKNGPLKFHMLIFS
jgi:hypothetical protein